MAWEPTWLTRSTGTTAPLLACCEKQLSLPSDSVGMPSHPPPADTPRSPTEPEYSPTLCSAAPGSPSHLRLWAAPVTSSDMAWPPCLAPGSPCCCLWHGALAPPLPPLHASYIDPTIPAAPPAPATLLGLSPGPAGQSRTHTYFLPHCNCSPAMLSNRSTPPLAHTGPTTSTQRRAAQHQPLHWQPLLYREGLWPSASLPAPGAPPSPGPQLEPSSNRGPSPDPPRASPPTLGSLIAPRLLQREHKRSWEGRRDIECLFSHMRSKSQERVCSGARGPQCSPCPWDTLPVNPRAVCIDQ